MQLIKRIVLCFLTTCFLPLVLVGHPLPTAAPEEVGLSGKKLSDTVSAMQKLVDEQRIAGGVVVVARRGKVAQFEPCGMMDIKDQKPMTQDTIFRIYSMSKPITSVAAMILYEEEKIRLDDPVHEYIPQFKGLTVVAGIGRAHPGAREAPCGAGSGGGDVWHADDGDARHAGDGGAAGSCGVPAGGFPGSAAGPGRGGATPGVVAPA